MAAGGAPLSWRSEAALYWRSEIALYWRSEIPLPIILLNHTLLRSSSIQTTNLQASEAGCQAARVPRSARGRV